MSLLPLSAILARLAAEGFRMDLRGGHIAVTPKSRVTPEIRDSILRHRTDILELLRLHGPRLLGLFSDAPAWPPAAGRDGRPVDYDGLIRLIGAPVASRDGKGTLRAVLYDTRTGRVRLRVETPKGGLLLDPEDIEVPMPATAGAAVATE